MIPQAGFGSAPPVSVALSCTSAPGTVRVSIEAPGRYRSPIQSQLNGCNSIAGNSGAASPVNQGRRTCCQKDSVKQWPCSVRMLNSTSKLEYRTLGRGSNVSSESPTKSGVQKKRCSSRSVNRRPGAPARSCRLVAFVESMSAVRGVTAASGSAAESLMRGALPACLKRVMWLAFAVPICTRQVCLTILANDRSYRQVLVQFAPGQCMKH